MHGVNSRLLSIQWLIWRFKQMFKHLLVDRLRVLALISSWIFPLDETYRSVCVCVSIADVACARSPPGDWVPMPCPGVVPARLFVGRSWYCEKYAEWIQLAKAGHQLTS